MDMLLANWWIDHNLSKMTSGGRNETNQQNIIHFFDIIDHQMERVKKLCEERKISRQRDGRLKRKWSLTGGRANKLGGKRFFVCVWVYWMGWRKGRCRQGIEHICKEGRQRKADRTPGDSVKGKRDKVNGNRKGQQVIATMICTF